MLARASEQLVPEQRLARIVVELGRPVPMAGFTIAADMVRSGRATSTTQMTLLDLDGRVCAQARGLHISERPVLDATRGDSFVPPRLDDSEPGDFPVRRNLHGLTGFRSATEVRYPIGEDCELGPTTLWMRTVANLLPGEPMSPFQRICPLADCGNAFSRQAEAWEIGFVNADLVVALHRDPIGEWMGMASTAVWQPSGIGLVSSALFDEHGSVGRAMQTLVLQPAVQ